MYRAKLLINIFVYFLLFFLSVQRVCAYEPKLLSALTDKIKKGQILDVYRELDEIDPINQEVDIFLLKFNLALVFHVVQVQYEKFGFINLEDQQSIEEVRGKPGTYSLFALNIASILDSLILQHPEDPRLYKAQSDYYYECFLNYDKDFALSIDDLKQRLELSSQKAMALGSADDETFFALGFLALEKEQYHDALKMFKTSMLLNSQNYLLYNHLAYAEYGLNHFDAAIAYAKKAVDKISDVDQKANSYRILSFSYDSKNYTDSAIYFIEEGILLQSSLGPELLRDYLYLAVRAQLPVSQLLIKEIISLNPESPEVYNAVINAYHQEGGDFMQVYKVLEDMEAVHAKNDRVMSNVYFYQGQILYDNAIDDAKDKLRKSRAKFLNYFPPTHEVFQVIERYLEGP